MAELRIQGRPLEVGDTIVWAGDGWEPHALEARPHRVTHVHTDRIVRVAMGPTQSHNFVSGSTGWRIKEDGSAEFNDVTVRGTIYASAGEIGGWTIAATELYGGSGASRVGLRPGTYPFYAGAEDPASAPFRVTAAGALVATSATITGSITATSGTIGGWSISSTQIKSDSDTIILDKVGIITVAGAGYLTSNPFTSGTQGWRITPTEAEFENIVARGEIRTAVFKYNEVHAQAGQLLVSPNAAKLDADLTIAASGCFDVGEAGRFSPSDIVRLKDGTNDVWLTVTADGGDGTYNYTRQSGAGAGTVFRAGTGVVGYGASGEGGVLLDAVSANGPFMDVFTHAGSPWTTITTKVRVGNLAGIVDADLNPSGYGFYCDNVFLKGKLVWSKGSLDADGITLDIDETADEAWIKFGSVNDYIRGISGGGIAIHSLEDWIDIRAWKSGSDARCTVSPASSGGSTTLSYNNTEAGSPDTTGFAKLLYQDYVTEVAVVAAGYRQVRMYAQNGSGVYEWFELQPTASEAFIKLGDAAGAHKFRVKDSAGVTQFEVSSDGVVIAASDADVYAELGRARLGYAGFADCATFGHRDFFSTTGYAVLQSAEGHTYVNAASGCILHLRINNTNQVWVDTSGLRVKGSINESTELGAVVYNNAAIVTANNTWTVLTFNSERSDTDGIHSTASNTDRLTCVHAGMYYIYAIVEFDSNATGNRGVQVLLNGATSIAAMNIAAIAGGWTTVVALSRVYPLSAGNYVTVRAIQSSGGNLNVLCTGNQSPEFGMVRVP
jgi:hypothetical protein